MAVCLTLKYGLHNYLLNMVQGIFSKSLETSSILNASRSRLCKGAGVRLTRIVGHGRGLTNSSVWDKIKAKCFICFARRHVLAQLSFLLPFVRLFSPSIVLNVWELSSQLSPDMFSGVNVEWFDPFQRVFPSDRVLHRCPFGMFTAPFP